MSKSNWDRGFVSGAKAGTKGERERVLTYLQLRSNELKECGKDDTCNDLWHYTQGIIEDITEGEH